MYGREGRKPWLLIFLIVLPVVTGPVGAQTAGSISGRVTDESGAALPGVTVEARGAALYPNRSTVTDLDGVYRFAALPAGQCGLSFRLPGFASVAMNGLDLFAGETRKIDAVMRLAVTAELIVTGKKAPVRAVEDSDAEGNLIGIASSSSEGSVDATSLGKRPSLRPADLLESVPGLVATQHSGEGKANQYYLRGFDLDHGTDFATTVAGIPVNMPSHAHGQGYSDLNFVIPELVGGLQYKKGPYFAEQGDFATSGSASIEYVNTLEKGIAKTDGGNGGRARLLLAQSPRLGEGTLLWALELAHADGPWVHPDNTRESSGVIRYSRAGEEDAFSVMAMGYRNQWNSTDQVAERAIASGLISRYGAIDPTDGGETHRYSLSTDWQHNGIDSVTRATAYAIDYGLKLFSNFTYDLVDPVNGDQFEQVDRRVVTGLKASHQWLSEWLGRETRTTLGIQVRNDNIAENGVFHTRAREVLDTVRLDHIVQTSVSLYAENSLRWSDKLRTVVGLRTDSYRFHVHGDDRANSGDAGKSLVSPKLSIVLGPWLKTEFYGNAGYGFHSNDARGATITQDPRTREPIQRATPLVAAKGAEVGIRSALVPHLQTTLSFWGLDIGSELVFAGDTGTTEPSRPSRRTGIEVTSSWAPLPWLSFDADAARSRPRFKDFNPVGDHIPGAVETVISAGVSAESVSGFFGSVRLRDFGPRPLTEDAGVRSKPSRLVNAQLGYEIIRDIRLSVDVFNVFNEQVSDVDYFYTSRLPGEPASGVADIHTHPAEPRTARLALLYSF